MYRLTGLITAVLVCLSANPTAAAPASVFSKEVFTVKGVSCSLVNSSWEPGTKLDRSRFLPRTSELEELLALAKGRQGDDREKLYASAAELRRKIAIEREVCQRGLPFRFDIRLTQETSMDILPAHAPLKSDGAVESAGKGSRYRVLPYVERDVIRRYDEEGTSLSVTDERVQIKQFPAISVSRLF